MVMEKPSSLILAQCDHVTGELLGYAVGRLMELGARNVQILPGVTKKNRTGNTLMIDPGAHEPAVADFLARELKISGYQRLNTTHVFHEVAFAKRKVVFKKGGRSAPFDCSVKTIGPSSAPLSRDVENDFLIGVQTGLMKKFGLDVSVSELRGLVEARLDEGDGDILIDL